MKHKLSNIVTACVTGIGIGVPITLCCMTMIGGFNSVVKEFLVWTVASALFGLVSTIFFSVRSNLSLPAATALHCISCMAVAAGAGAIIGYADSFLELLLNILPVFLIVYALVYAGVFFAMKKEAERINEELHNK